MDLSIGTELWHSHYKRGILCNVEGMFLSIDFDEFGNRIVSKDAFGHGLYLSKEEVNFTDYKFLEDKYNVPREILGYYPCIVEDYAASISDTGEFRSFVILTTKGEVHKGRKYYKIFAVDVQTARVVILVDTNGMAHGLHTDQDSIEKLKYLDVIRVFVKEVTEGSFHNAIRIAGDIQFIGTSDLPLLERKYRDLKGHVGYPNHTIKMSFQELFALAHTKESKEVAGLVWFSETQIRPKKGKSAGFQVKMGPVFADLDIGLIGNEQDALFYRGYALVTAFVPSDEHRARVRVVKLFARPSKMQRPKKGKTSLEVKAGAFVNGVTHWGNDKTEMELRKALCDVDGTLTEKRRQLYNEALTMLQTSPQEWSQKQKDRFFDGMLFFALKEDNPKMDYGKWLKQEFQQLDLTMLDFNLYYSRYRNDFLSHYLKIIYMETGPIPTHRYKLYVEVLKIVLDMFAEYSDLMLDPEQRNSENGDSSFDLSYVDESVSNNEEHEEGSAYFQCDDSYFNDFYEEYSEYNNEEESGWDIDL